LDITAMHSLRMKVRENRLSPTTRISEASYPRYIAAGSAWVAEARASIVGFAAIDAQTTSVWALFVDPQAEGVGVGQALHIRMIEWARHHGLRRLTLSTEEGSRAVRFYSKAGWTQTGSTSDGEVFFQRSVLS
jgi:GNAT superfamily N-acetyltransferase